MLTLKYNPLYFKTLDVTFTSAYSIKSMLFLEAV